MKNGVKAPENGAISAQTISQSILSCHAPADTRFSRENGHACIPCLCRKILATSSKTRLSRKRGERPSTPAVRFDREAPMSPIATRSAQSSLQSLKSSERRLPLCTLKHKSDEILVDHQPIPASMRTSAWNYPCIPTLSSWSMHVCALLSSRPHISIGSRSLTVISSSTWRAEFLAAQTPAKLAVLPSTPRLLRSLHQLCNRNRSWPLSFLWPTSTMA